MFSIPFYGKVKHISKYDLPVGCDIHLPHTYFDFRTSFTFIYYYEPFVEYFSLINSKTISK